MRRKASEECDPLGHCSQKAQLSWRPGFGQCPFDSEETVPAFVAFLPPDPVHSLMVPFSALDLVCSSSDLLSGRIYQTLLQAWKA